MLYFSVLKNGLKPFVRNVNGIPFKDYKVWFSDEVESRELKNDYIIFVIGDLIGNFDYHGITKMFKNPQNSLSLDGIFTIIGLDKVNYKIYILSDMSGMYPLFYTNVGSSILISNIAYEIGKAIQAEPNFDEINLLIASGRTSMGSSIYKKVYSTFPASLIEFDLKENNTKIFKYDIEFLREDDYCDSIKDISGKLITLLKSGYKYLKEKVYSPVSDISGGSDSRITTMIASFVFDDLKLYVSNKNRVDYIISHKFSKHCLSRFEYIPPFTDKIEYMDDDLDKSSICKLYAGVSFCKDVMNKLANDMYKFKYSDLHISGYPGEIFKDFWLKRLRNLDSMGISRSELNFLLRTSFLHNPGIFKETDTLSYLASRIFDDFSDYLNIKKRRIIDLIYLRYYARVAWQYFILGKFPIKKWFPFLSNKVLMLSLKTPTKFRYYENIHSHVLHLLNPIKS